MALAVEADEAEGGSVQDRHEVVDLGEFPFPVLDQGRESRQLVWVRNHANYMARRGWLDYVRAISVMVRGAIVNILIGLPFLILIALGVAALSVYGWGFRAAVGLVAVAWIWTVASPIGERLWAVVRIRNTIAVGSNSTVATRDRIERAFGALVVLIVAAAIFESLSFFLDDFHFWTREHPRDGRALATVVTFSLGFMSAAGRLLPRLPPGKGFKIAITLIGLIGLLSPLVVVMFLADYFVYSGPTAAGVRAVMVAGIVLGAIVGVGIVVGMVAGALSRRNGGIALILLVGLTLVLIGPAQSGLEAVEERQANLDTDLAELDLSLNSVEELRFDVENADGAVEPEVSASEFAERQREFQQLVDSAAQRPLREVAALVDFLDRAREEASFRADTVAEQSSTPFGDPGFRGRYPFLDDAAGALPELYTLVALLPPEDVERLDAELLELDSRMIALLPIVDAWPVEAEEASMEEPAPTELVEAVLVFFDDDIIAEVFDIDANQYPELATLLPVPFGLAQEELRGLGQLLREVRIEVNRVAVFSSQYPNLRQDAGGLRAEQLGASAIFALMLAALLWAYVWIAVDPNRTSLHRLYRDRLATAFLVGKDTEGDVDVEEDLDLGELSRHEAGSTAPYHLVNAAVNLPNSDNIDLHDRRSDFFVFSKRFIGSKQTGYCRSDTMERAFPDMSLSTAMAVSGAAASPAMGRMTQPALVALMTILNIRLGFWIPNPGKLEEKIGYPPGPVNGTASQPPGFTIDHVLACERGEVERRWLELGAIGQDRSWERGTFGLACSGGGIRSATLNLGIAQALHQAGVFDHVDYLSTVSGGGFFGSSVSSAMRSRESTRSGVTGSISVEKLHDRLEVVIDPARPTGLRRKRVREPLDLTPEVHVFGRDATICPEADPRSNRKIKAGTRLLDLGDPDITVPGRETAVRERRWWHRDRDTSPFGLQFKWRVNPTSLLREFAGKLDDKSRWVNVSDGGHIENLGLFELLRRRCRFIIVGDGEYDPGHEFGGLAVVTRAARLELDTRILIDLDPLRPDQDGRCPQHWAVGRIRYPGGESGHLLYLKSSLTEHEDGDLDIAGYGAKNPEFPHQPTADQLFDEGQFEAYRRLGYRIAKSALCTREAFARSLDRGRDRSPRIPFDEVEAWFESFESMLSHPTGVDTVDVRPTLQPR